MAATKKNTAKKKKKKKKKAPKGEARNPELEAVIREHLDDREGYIVYSDWLLQEGDPRGQLIALQIKIEENPMSLALDMAEKDWFTEHEEAFLGPLAKWQRIRGNQGMIRTLSWRYGFLRAARFHAAVGDDASLAEMVEALLTHPSARFLERLMIARTSWDERDEVAEVLAVMKAHAPPTLSTLVIGSQETWRSPSLLDLTGLNRAAMPSLRSLIVTQLLSELVIDKNGMEMVEMLHLAWAPPPVIRSIAAARWPSVKKLHLTLDGTCSFGMPVDLLLAKFPALEHFIVRSWNVERGEIAGGVQPEDDLAISVIEACANSQKVRRLDLEIALSARGVERAWEVPQEGIELLTMPMHRGLRGLPPTTRAGFAWAKAPETQNFADLDPLAVGISGAR